MKNVVIFIDYENIHKRFLEKNQNLLSQNFFEKLRIWCNKEGFRILDIKAYCNFDIKDLYESRHQTKLQEYGVETYHTSNKSKNYADLKIATDLMEELYENSNIDGFILISNDKDMTPLIKAVKRYKEFIYLITNENSFDNALRNFPDKHITIEEILNNIDNTDITSNLNDIPNKIMTNLTEYITNSKNISSRKHYSLKKYVDNLKVFLCLPEYEVLNQLNLAYQQGLIVIYKYTFNSSNYEGIISKTLEESAITGNLFTKNDIITCYNFDKAISESYQKY